MKFVLITFLLTNLMSCTKNNILWQRMQLEHWLNRNYKIDAIYVNGQSEAGYLFSDIIDSVNFKYKAYNAKYNLSGLVNYYSSWGIYSAAYFRLSDNLDKLYAYKINTAVKTKSNLPSLISNKTLPNPYNTYEYNLNEVWSITEISEDALRIRSIINDTIYEVHFKPLYGKPL